MPIVVTHGPSAASISGVGSVIGAAQFQKAQQQLGLQVAGLIQQQQLTREKIDASERQQTSSQIAAMNRLLATGQIQAGRDATQFQQNLINRGIDGQLRQALGVQQFGQQLIRDKLQGGRAIAAREQQKNIQIAVNRDREKEIAERQKAALDHREELAKPIRDANRELARRKSKAAAGRARQVASGELTPQQAVAGLHSDMAEMKAFATASEVDSIFPPTIQKDPLAQTVEIPGLDDPIKLSPGESRIFEHNGQQFISEWRPEGTKTRVLERPLAWPQESDFQKRFATYEKNIEAAVTAQFNAEVNFRLKMADKKATAPSDMPDRETIRKQVMTRFTRPVRPIEDRPDQGPVNRPDVQEQEINDEPIEDRPDQGSSPGPAPSVSPEITSVPESTDAVTGEAPEPAMSEEEVASLSPEVVGAVKGYLGIVNRPDVREPAFMTSAIRVVAEMSSPGAFGALEGEEKQLAVSAIAQVMRFNETMDRPLSPPSSPEQKDMLQTGGVYFPIIIQGKAWFAVWDGEQYQGVSEGGGMTDLDVAAGASPLDRSDDDDDLRANEWVDLP